MIDFNVMFGILCNSFVSDTPFLEIDVPDMLLKVPTAVKSSLCQRCEQTVVEQCWFVAVFLLLLLLVNIALFAAEDKR